MSTSKKRSGNAETYPIKYHLHDGGPAICPKQTPERLTAALGYTDRLSRTPDRRSVVRRETLLGISISDDGNICVAMWDHTHTTRAGDVGGGSRQSVGSSVGDPATVDFTPLLTEPSTGGSSIRSTPGALSLIRRRVYELYSGDLCQRRGIGTAPSAVTAVEIIPGGYHSPISRRPRPSTCGAAPAATPPPVISAAPTPTARYGHTTGGD